MKKSVRLFFILSLLFIVLSSSFILAGQLKVTEEHPFLVNGKWISASELQIGEELTTIDGQKIVIKNLSVVNSEEEFSVYNLEAEDIHNFVVTEDNLVVHNSDASNLGFGPCKGNYANCPILRYQIRSPASGVARSEIFRGVDPQKDIKKVLEWINSAPSPAMKLVRTKYAESITKISLQELDQGLKNAILNPTDGLNKILSDGKPYAVILGRNSAKSTNWVYELSKPYLSRGPVLESYINYQAANHPESLLNKAYGVGVRRFVIFDDVSYSGLELSGQFVDPMIQIGDIVDSPIEIIIATPFMTTQAKEAILFSASKNPNAIIKILPNKKIFTLNEMFTPGELVDLDINVRTAHEHALTFTEWKVPDEVSLDSHVYGLLEKNLDQYESLRPYSQPLSLYYQQERIGFQAFLEHTKNLPSSYAVVP